MKQDTIAAIATAPGRAGIGIIRLSGPDAEAVLGRVFRPASAAAWPLESHRMTYGRVMDGSVPVDECMAVLMRAPRSYTREDVAELQLHGGSYNGQRALRLCLDAGARLAEPGEFSRRAFLNGRMDLSEAEAVMALIAADSEAAHRAAVQQLTGGAASFIRRAADELYSIEAGAAACMDYPEEIGEEEAAGDLLPRLEKLTDGLARAADERSARLVRDGLQVVLCGRPNVGKSSLLNALLGEEKAIVTEIPGTTRDIVSGDMTLNGCAVHLTDTAGIRETDDPVEKIGVRRAEKAMEGADVILALIDGAAPLAPEDEALLASLDGDRAAVVLSKEDLETVTSEEDIRRIRPGLPVLTVSSMRPESLAALRQLLAERCALRDGLVLTQPRQLDAAHRAVALLKSAAEALRQGQPIDLALADMQSAASALAEITGDQADERLLDAVFSQFCVGK